jgi:hypothetical protein
VAAAHQSATRILERGNAVRRIKSDMEAFDFASNLAEIREDEFDGRLNRRFGGLFSTQFGPKFSEVIFDRHEPQMRALQLGESIPSNIGTTSCSGPQHSGGNAEDDGEERSDARAVVIKEFTDLSPSDKRHIISGAIFCAGLGVFIAYLCINGGKI